MFLIECISMSFICFVLYCLVEGAHTILMGPFIWRSFKIEALCAVLVAVVIVLASLLIRWFIGEGLDITARSGRGGYVGTGRYSGNLLLGIIAITTAISSCVYYVFHIEDMRHGLDWAFVSVVPLSAIIIDLLIF